MSIRRIVIGVDGSRNSQLASETAGELARLAGAEVVAVHAMGLLEQLGDGDTSTEERREQVRRELETTWTDILRRAEVPVRCELRDGHPVEVLVGLAREIEADLVVIGRRGTGTAAERLLGSNSAQLAGLAPCPLLIVPDRPDDV